MKKFVFYAAVVVVTLALFDVAAYFTLPRSVNAVLNGYREPLSSRDLLIAGRGSYSRDYFVGHPERGFDLGENRRGRHYLQELGFYDIWSNELGCFDDPYEPHNSPEDYVYLGGDSYTWGYAPHQDHFGTLLENALELQTLQCGVTHTGQRHQFDKFLDVTARIGRWPEVVVVNHVANDIADDYSYPNSTVVDGWLVDAVELTPDNSVVPIPHDEIVSRIERRLSSANESWSERAKRFLRRHSASAQIVHGLATRFSNSPADVTAQALEAEAQADGRGPAEADVAPRRGVWELYRAPDRYPYAEPYAHANQEALLRWQEHAHERGYALMVVLIGTTPGYYRDMHEFLRSHEFDFFDFADDVAPRLGQEDLQGLVWRHEGHFNLRGQQIYSDYLVASLKQLCEQGAIARDTAVCQQLAAHGD